MALPGGLPGDGIEDREEPSGDGGESWERMNEVNTRPFYYSQVRVDPSDPDRVYFSSTPVQFSTDGGKTYGTTTNGIHVDHHAMWIDPVDPDRIMVGSDGGVSITFDKGGNWVVPPNQAIWIPMVTFAICTRLLCTIGNCHWTRICSAYSPSS